MYWRKCFTAGIDHENRYILVASAPYYPPDSHLLVNNKEKYPIRQLIETLKERWGDAWQDRYRPPERLLIDVLDEYVPDNLNALNNTLERLRDLFNATCVCGSWEQDFARTRYLATPVQGDKAFFSGVAASALDEGRVQVSASAKRLLARDDVALVATGMAISSLERMNPYSSYQSSSIDRAYNFALNYGG
jgi:hypothetical protein